jgi:dTDP-4-amino-4,6-dideoxygalactose transaminase
VHLYGNAADMGALLKISKKYNLPIIEDAAESLGATYQNLPLGTFGDFGILSFNGNKIITTSGGGALICPDSDSYERGLFYATQARDEAPHFQHSEIGYNYRLSNVLASLGNAQLRDLNERVQKKREIFNAYKTQFAQLNKNLGRSFISSTVEKPHVHANRWLSTFLIEPIKGVSTESWRLKLAEHGIESRPLWKPMHLQPVFKEFPFYGNHTSDYIFEKGICLPSGHDLSMDQIDEITSIIASLYQ